MNRTKFNLFTCPWGGQYPQSNHFPKGIFEAFRQIKGTTRHSRVCHEKLPYGRYRLPLERYFLRRFAPVSFARSDRVRRFVWDQDSRDLTLRCNNWSLYIVNNVLPGFAFAESQAKQEREPSANNAVEAINAGGGVDRTDEAPLAGPIKEVTAQTGGTANLPCKFADAGGAIVSIILCSTRAKNNS